MQNSLLIVSVLPISSQTVVNQRELFTRGHQGANLLWGELVHHTQMRSQVGHAATHSSAEHAGRHTRVHLAVVIKGDSAGVELAAYLTSKIF